MMRMLFAVLLIIPITIFAFSFNVGYRYGYLSLNFFDATSTVEIYINNVKEIQTSLDSVSFFVGERSFRLSIRYNGRTYTRQIGKTMYCDVEVVSKSATTITYSLNFQSPLTSPPSIEVYSQGIKLFYSFKFIDSKTILLTLPIPNDFKYFKFHVEGYKIKYNGLITQNVGIDSVPNDADLSVYTDYSSNEYWITLVLQHFGYFVGKPIITISADDLKLNISKYFINKNGYIFGTYRYKKGFLKTGEYRLNFLLGNYRRSYRFYIYKSIAFFPDIHKQISATISKIYTVKPGDTLYYIAVNNGTDVQSLIKLNHLNNGDNIIAGEKLLIGKVRFAPSPDTIIISQSNSRLYLFHNHKFVASFFVSPGVKNKTPFGRFQIIRKIKNPTLYWEGEKIPPLSPINGLGTRFLQLSDPQYGIHGTTKPWEIGRRVSHGCIRMMNHDVEMIFNMVQVGTKVFIVKDFVSSNKKLSFEEIVDSKYKNKF